MVMLKVDGFVDSADRREKSVLVDLSNVVAMVLTQW